MSRYLLIAWGGSEIGRRPRTKLALQNGDKAAVLRVNPWEQPRAAGRYYDAVPVSTLRVLHHWPEGQTPNRGDVRLARNALAVVKSAEEATEPETEEA